MIASQAASLSLPARLLNEQQAAQYLNRGRSTFRKQRAEGHLPQPTDFNGRRPLWDIRVLDRFVDMKSGIVAHDDTWADL